MRIIKTLLDKNKELATEVKKQLVKEIEKELLRLLKGEYTQEDLNYIRGRLSALFDLLSAFVEGVDTEEIIRRIPNNYLARYAKLIRESNKTNEK